MRVSTEAIAIVPACIVLSVALVAATHAADAQTDVSAIPQTSSRFADARGAVDPISTHYRQLQTGLAQGWNTWDVHSVTTHVLLPEGLAINVGVKHNATVRGDEFLWNTLIGRLETGAEQVVPGPHTWDGSYSDLRISWKGHTWRVQSAHDGSDLVLLATPLPARPQPAVASAYDRVFGQLSLESPRNGHPSCRRH